MRFLDHPNLIKCSKMQTRKQIIESEANENAGLSHLSVRIKEIIRNELPYPWICLQCFMDCLYKKSKYISKGDTLKLKMLKLDAEHLYEKQPKEKEYYIKAMYDLR